MRISEAIIRKYAQNFLYHETQKQYLNDIALDGLHPMSYGQSFVGEQGEMLSPEMLEDEELENIPEEDMIQRTYVRLQEPSTFLYGDILLRFPNMGFKIKRDVDEYILDVVPPEVIEVKIKDGWVRLVDYVGNKNEI